MVSIRTQQVSAAITTTPADRASSFDILQDSLGQRHLSPSLEPLPLPDKDANSFSSALGELDIDHFQNTCSHHQKDVSQPRLAKPPIEQQHIARFQRPALSAHTFEPLATLDENSEKPTVKTEASRKVSSSHSGPLVLGPSSSSSSFHYSLQEQVQKQLAGQFEWLISCPAKASSSAAGLNQLQLHNSSRETDAAAVLYGCNLLRYTPKLVSSHPASAGQQSTNRITLLATPISGNLASLSPITPSVMSLGHHQLPPRPLYKVPSSVKVPDVVDMVERALSPDLSSISDPSESLAASSRTGSFSHARIGDALEELDMLQNDVEAVGALAKVKPVLASNQMAAKSTPAKSRAAANSPLLQSGKSLKQASVMSPPNTNKTSQPLLQRSASMSLRQKKQPTVASATKKVGNPAAGQATNRLSLASTPTSKSAKKPPTVAKFELPGEAVARRLKEQKEARQALIEKSQKASTAPPKPRTLTKPSFELPGEAISRRKREQHEAKLRAEEEELRRKREFKARPIRNRSAPEVAPRETIASRARQAKLQEEEAKAKAAAAAAATLKAKRMSLQPGGISSAASTVGKSATLATRTAQQSQSPSSLRASSKTMRGQSNVGDGGVDSVGLRAKPAQKGSSIKA